MLGLVVSVEGDGVISVPEAKRQGLLHDMRQQLGELDRGNRIDRQDVERLPAGGQALPRVPGRWSLRVMHTTSRCTGCCMARAGAGTWAAERGHSSVR